MIRIDPAIKELASVFTNNGKQAYLVGGAVRDMLMGKKIHDWDLATDALPEEVIKIARRAGGKAIPTGIKHGTVTVIYKNVQAEITTFRCESGYSDGRRPDNVRFAATIEEDLSRRDFTMNAAALRLPENTVVDPFCGAKDIKAKIIRCVGNPSERFSEDGLRPLRAVRFASQLGFTIEDNTLQAISGALNTSAKVSKERVRDEIDKILDSPLPSRAFLLMEQTGLLELFLPELAACRGIEQKGFHEFDVLDHCLHACNFAANKGFSREVRLASLLHDIGKPRVRELKGDVWTFYRHEDESCKIARNILTRLRYPNAVIDSVCHLIKEHMYNYTSDWSDAAVRRFIARVGEANLKDIYDLRRADTYGFTAKEQNSRSLADLIKRVDKILAAGSAFSLKDLAVTGNDLIAIGIKPGKTMGYILNELLETVLDDPAMNTKEMLLQVAKRIEEGITIP